jgi:hypothetical protein
MSSNTGRPKPEVKPSPTNTGRWGFMKYLDSFGAKKTYPEPQPAPTTMLGSDMPFEPEVMKKVLGRVKAEKARVQLSESVIRVPMLDANKRKVWAYGHFLKYTGPGGSATITPGGDIYTGGDAHMRMSMVPGMTGKTNPETGRTDYSIPEAQMWQPSSNFSYTKPDES